MKTSQVIGRLSGITLLAATAACAPTRVMLGQARPPVTPDQVRVYDQPPSTYQPIALLDASSKSAFGTGGQKSVNKVIERLKVDASKLGANGLLIEGFSDAQTASIGTGGGSESYSGHSAVGVGVGASFGIYKKTGHAEAIYVSPATPVQVPAPVVAPVPDAPSAASAPPVPPT
jgi:hypothetical protein